MSDSESAKDMNWRSTVVTNTETGNRSNIVRATGIVSLASVALYFFWYLREYAVSARLGAGADMDAFLVAYSVPFVLGNSITGVVQVVLIPAYARAKMRGKEAVHAFCTRTYSWMIIVLMALCVGQALGAPWIIRLIGNGFSQPQLDIAVQLMWLLIPMSFFWGMFGVISAFLLAEQRFGEATLLTAVSSVVPAAVVWFGAKSLGIHSFAIGSTLGWAVQLVITLGIWMKSSKESLLPFELYWDSAQVREMMRLAGPVLLGVAAYGLVPAVDRAMASHLPTGSIAALGYADRLFQVVASGFGALQVAIFPYFSEQVAARQVALLRTDFSHTLGLVLFITLPATALIIFYTRPLVQLLFGRGAFDAAAVTLTSRLLMVYGFSLSITVVGNTASRLVNAFQDSAAILIVGLLNLVTKILLNALLIPSLGPVGLPLAFSGMTILATTVLLLRARRQIRPLTERWFVKSVGSTVIALLGMLIMLSGLKFSKVLDFAEWSWLMYAGAGLGFYVVLCWILRVEASGYLINYFLTAWLKVRRYFTRS